MINILNKVAIDILCLCYSFRSFLVYRYTAIAIELLIIKYSNCILNWISLWKFSEQ
jgi:hypothetical protein